jgi:class 3 adenylate cyclase
MAAEPVGSKSGTATILFTDLVGSTELRTRLGEERAEAQRRITLSEAVRDLDDPSAAEVRFERLRERL